jgi:predicted metal-dependent hydrolase
MWSRQGSKKATRYRRLGCFMPLQNIIKINPILDDISIPDYFIEYIVYHEMLHAVYPPILGAGKRVVHHKKFVEMEKKFPDYLKAKAWEKKEGKKKFF